MLNDELVNRIMNLNPEFEERLRWFAECASKSGYSLGELVCAFERISNAETQRINCEAGINDLITLSNQCLRRCPFRKGIV